MSLYTEKQLEAIRNAPGRQELRNQLATAQQPILQQLRTIMGVGAEAVSDVVRESWSLELVQQGWDYLMSYHRAACPFSYQQHAANPQTWNPPVYLQQTLNEKVGPGIFLAGFWDTLPDWESDMKKTIEATQAFVVQSQNR